MLQTPNRPTETRSNQVARRRWLKPALAILALVVIGAMVLGMISNFQANKTASMPAALEDSRQASNSSADGAYYKGVAPGATVAAAATTAAAGATAPLPASQAGSGTSGSYTPPNLNSDRMIIRNATLSLQADDVEKLLGDIRALAIEQNGTVMQASTSSRDNKVYANVTIQIPSGAFDQTISRLRKLVYKVDSENTTSQDVTEEFVDTDAQVRNLKATEAVYLDLLKKAVNVNDTLTIQRELSNVRGQIERLQGRVNYLQKKSDNSTITLSISPRLTETEQPKTAGWDAGKVLSQAWEGSLRGLQGLATVLITLGVYLWWILPLLLLGYFVARYSWKRFVPAVNRSTPPPPPAAPTTTV